MSPHEVDVVVVGARAAGAATALLLARAGLSVVVLDRDRPGADTLSTHALMRGGVVQLGRWGVLPAVVAAGTPPIRATTFHYASGPVRLAIKPAAGVDALYAPRRTVLDPILADAAAHAGAQVRYRTALRALATDRGLVTGVDVAHPAGGTERVRCRIVVGADGRRSTVARLVGARTTHRVATTSACTYGYYRGLEDRGYEWAYGPGAAGGFIPTDDGLTCVFASNRPERVGRGGPTALRAGLAAASPDLADRLRAARLVPPVRTFVGQPGFLRRAWGPGWALVGDAGAWHDPITSHGLTSAFRDAEILGRAIVDALAGDRPAATAYAAYEATRDRLSLPIMHGGAEIAAMRWDDGRIVGLLRELNAAMNQELEVIGSAEAQQNATAQSATR